MGLHGKPDWGLQLKSTVYSMDDLAELAVRLGSISSFDRRGDIIFQDSFNHGLGKGVVAGSGDDNDQKLTADYFLNGGYSLKLVGGKTTQFYSQHLSYLPYPVLSKIGYELALAFETYVDYVQMMIYLYKSDEQVRGGIRYDDTKNELQYINSANKWIAFATDYYMQISTRLFNKLKLVIDFENDEYVRAIVNDRTYDLSGEAVGSVSASYAPRIETKFSIYSRDGHNDIIYLDDIIITQNEP